MTSRCTKYTSLEPISGVRGYIVNIHDTLDFDIDLDLPLTAASKYKSVISGTYTYTENDEIKEGKTLRCRLRDIITINRKTKKQIAAMQTVIRFTDRLEGWVICQLHDIDIYSRLLVDIADHETGKSLDEVLLARYPTNFSRYTDYR